jgi:hypothetical protein
VKELRYEHGPDVASRLVEESFDFVIAEPAWLRLVALAKQLLQKQTFVFASHMSAFGGKADITLICPNVR